jgi:RNA polymerase sigma-70 factor (sigma-E family)
MTSQRDEEFTQFVEPRLPGLRRAAYLLCGDWARGDDIVQRTLTDAYVHFARLQQADSPDAYLRTVLTHRWIDEQRGLWSRVRLLDAVPERAGPADAGRDEAIDLHAALARLTARQRAVLVLRFLCDMSVADTAAALHCSEGTVKSQTSVALHAMRQHLTTPTTKGSKHEAIR